MLLAWLGRGSAWRRSNEPVRLQPGHHHNGRERNGDRSVDGDARGRTAREGNGQLRRLRLPPEALLLRRMQGLLYLTAAKARASERWGPLHRELLEGAEPVGELGAAHASWLATHHR